MSYAIAKKKERLFKTWQESKSEELKPAYKETVKAAKEAVAAANTAAWNEWSQNIATQEGHLEFFKGAKQMKIDKQDITRAKFKKKIAMLTSW